MAAKVERRHNLRNYVNNLYFYVEGFLLQDVVFYGKL